MENNICNGVFDVVHCLRYVQYTLFSLFPSTHGWLSSYWQIFLVVYFLF